MIYSRHRLTKPSNYKHALKLISKPWLIHRMKTTTMGFMVLGLDTFAAHVCRADRPNVILITTRIWACGIDKHVHSGK